MREHPAVIRGTVGIVAYLVGYTAAFAGVPPMPAFLPIIALAIALLLTPFPTSE
jgi:hypothetical protein